jgi:hypothetical protein
MLIAYLLSSYLKMLVNFSMFGININTPNKIRIIIITVTAILCFLINRDLNKLNSEYIIIPKTISPKIIFKVVIFLEFYHMHHK